MLFVGSGISFASNLPNLEKITRNLLKATWHNDKDYKFYPGEVSDSDNKLWNIAPGLQEFLNMLKKDCSPRRTKATYEDIFFLCQQIFDDQDGEVDNPAIYHFMKEIREKTLDLCSKIPSLAPVNLRFLAMQSLKLIQWVIYYSLQNPVSLKGLNLITELAKSDDIDKLDIATLNHDLLVEQHLKINGIKFIDGFDDADEKIRYFDVNSYNDNNTKIRMFKLHGSINWFRLRSFKDKRETERFAAIDDFDRASTKLDEQSIKLDPSPQFLTGSYNKLFSYDTGIFAKIHFKFLETLPNYQRMIMSGYGWNDRGINARLFDWILSSPKNRLILLYEKPKDDLERKSKSDWWYRYYELEEKGQIIPIEKYMKDITFTEMKKIVPDFFV